MKKFDSNTKLGQVITKEEVSNWKGNVIFDCGTASGKTTFILTTLSEYCLGNDMRILFLCNRKALVDEVESVIKEKNITNVDVKTYQYIESVVKRGNELDLDYQFIACDEFHHVLEVYNLYTDLSYNFILKHPSQKIFMSATCESLFEIYLDNGIVPQNQYYVIEKNYDYIDNIYFYNKKDDHKQIIENIITTSEDKVIFFTQSLTKAIEIYNTYKDISTFYCSKFTSNEEAKLILNDNIGKIYNEDFEGRLLISTVALDVGITLKNKEIKHIILDIYEWSNLVQTLGRKRLVDETDTCTVYIRNYSRRELNTKQNRHFEALDLFVNDRDEFDIKYGTDRTFNNPYIYNDVNTDTLKLNYLGYLSLLSKNNDLHKMIRYTWMNIHGETEFGIGYKRFICNKLKLKTDDVRIKNYDSVKEDKNVNNLIVYLDSVVGKRLFKDEQKELKEEFVKDGLQARTIGINTMNGNLADRKLPYIITSEKDNKRSIVVDGIKVTNPTYKKMYWIIGKITY